MEALSLSTLIGICMFVCLSAAVMNCLRCRKKLTEEQLQQKNFEKFRKKHMKARDHVLTNRVDVVRSRTDRQDSCTSFEHEPTYQTIKSICDLVIPKDVWEKPDVATVDDHSFFDESFQTVIEASSINTANLTDCKSNPNFLSASANLASYISFQQQKSSSSGFVLEPNETGNLGEINRAFSKESIQEVHKKGISYPNKSPRCHMGEPSLSQDMSSDTYVTPNYGPKICVTRASFQRDSYQKSSKGRNVVFSNEDVVEEPPYLPSIESENSKFENLEDGKISGFQALKTQPKSDIYTTEQSCVDSHVSIGKSYGTDSVLKANYLEKLRTEGRSYNRNPRGNQEKRSKVKTRLVIPHDDYFDSSDEDHTYESLTSVLAEGTMRRDSVDMISENSKFSCNTAKQKMSDCDNTYESIEFKSHENKPYVHIQSIDENKSNMEKSLRNRASDSDTAVVIIGRKISKRYRPNIPLENNNSEVKFSNILQSKQFNSLKSPSKSRRDSLERYSPFPSAKKLAIKSQFKQVASPHFQSMHLKPGHLKSTLYAELLNSATKNNIGIENFNIDTPEMKDSPKVFTIDSPVFLSPMNVLNKQARSISKMEGKKMTKFSSPQMFVHSPMEYYDTHHNGPFRKSLPSLPDDLELVLQNHCNEGVNAMSTPTV